MAAPVIVLKPTPDLVAANLNDDNLSVLLGDGTGGFAAAAGSPFAAADGPNVVALGDLDGDGDLDIVATNFFSHNVSVLLGNGAGSFVAAAGGPFAVGTAPNAVVLGDLDGDGNLDIVTANGFSVDDISVLLGDGTGGFAQAAGSPPAAGDAPKSVALGDLDGDGDLDIVTANLDSNNVTVLLGDGAGGFAAAADSPVAAGDRPFSVALGDLDGDGDLDIVTANIVSDEVSVLLGDGAGGFAQAAGGPLAAGDGPASIALGDLDGDGDLDIIAANRNSTTVSVLLGDGTGGFAAAAGSPPEVGAGPNWVALHDLDGDGNLDIITANPIGGNNVSVLLGNGAGGFAAAAGSPVAVGSAPFSVAVGDFNVLDEVSLTDTLAFTEGEIRRLLPAIMVADADGGTLAAATLTLGGGFAGSGDVLAAVTTGTGITASFDAGVLLLTGTDSIANYTKVLRSVTFVSGDDPTHGGANASRTIALAVDDGGVGGVSAAATVTVDITAQNDAPMNAAPGAQAVAANANLAVAGLSISDADSGASPLTTTLAVTHGTLTASGAGVSGSGTATVTLAGTLAQINAALATVIYRGTQDFFGTDTLTMSTDDNGNSGGSPLTDTDQVTIDVGTVLSGSPDDDSFSAPGGTVRIDAGLGTDTITFGFKLADATIMNSGNQVIVDGPSSSHTVLTGFERFVFADGTVDNVDGNRLIDDLFYYARNHDVWNARADADLHYSAIGWKEGRDPNAFFDTAIYLSANPDVAASGIDPLSHYDATGWKQGRVPSLEFDTRAYLDANPDVKAAGMNPLFHFLAVGASEGRAPIAPSELVTANGFDFVHYLANNPDVAASTIDPFWHFQTIGWTEGRDPNAWFDTAGYLAAYTDVAAAHVNPLDHYNTSGWHEGRDPSLGFDTASYLNANTDVAAAQINPLVHFLQAGHTEGRLAIADGVWGP